MRNVWLGAFATFAVACGGADISGLQGQDGGDASITPVDTGVPCDGCTTPVDTGPPPDTGPGCVGLQCQQVQCDGGTTTTVTGQVFAPNGTLPLYNVMVFVPNGALAPMTAGPVCDHCGSVLSGSPLVTALTDGTGKFVLKDVPVGSNIPIVIQVGKWRRQVTIPQIQQCQDNPVSVGTLRFPKNRTEGDMPRIAMVTGGCDPLACMLSKMGIDTTEFGDSSSGQTRVVWYNGQAGVAPGTPQPATALWNNLAEMQKFDLIVNSCECSEANQDKTSPMLLQQYADQGGRVFGSHYHYTWPRNLIQAWQGTAAWTTSGSTATPDLVDQSFPKGKALAQWLVTVNASSTLGQIPLNVKTYNVADVTAPTTRWLMASGGPPTTTHYLSFNTPVGQMPDKQCGKFAYAGLHVAAGMVGQTFPQQCMQNFSPDEKALAFVLFDLMSCVQDETKDPVPPPVKK